jgi:hypothetical protein
VSHYYVLAREDRHHHSGTHPRHRWISRPAQIVDIRIHLLAGVSQSIGQGSTRWFGRLQACLHVLNYRLRRSGPAHMSTHTVGYDEHFAEWASELSHPVLVFFPDLPWIGVRVEL